MLDQQIESASNRLVHFIQDLTANIQTIFNNQNFLQLFQLRSDYAKQLASLFDMLINKLLEEYHRNRSIQMRLNLDPVTIWRSIQHFIDQLNDLQWQDLNSIIKHIRTINKYFYNLLLQLKNIEFLKVDQTRTLNQNLIEELNSLSEILMHFTTLLYVNSQKMNNIKPQEFFKPVNTYLFPNISTTQYSDNNNNHLNETIPNLSSTEKSNIPPAMNSNCYPYNMTTNLQQQSQWPNIRRGPCFQPNSIPHTTRTVPTAGIFPQSKPMGCSNNPGKDGDTPLPLCFPTPVVYTPEMETLFSSSGIIYARKSGNTWVAENLGTLVETLKDIGQTIDMNEHCEILVRKTGELFVRRKRGRRKRFLQQNLNKATSHGNNPYEKINIHPEQSDSNISDDDDDQ